MFQKERIIFKHVFIEREREREKKRLKLIISNIFPMRAIFFTCYVACFFFTDQFR